MKVLPFYLLNIKIVPVLEYIRFHPERVQLII